MKEIDKYMTIAEAAHRWNIPQETVKNKLKPSIVGQEAIDKMIEKGHIKYFRREGSNRRDWILSAQAMKEWFEK